MSFPRPAWAVPGVAWAISYFGLQASECEPDQTSTPTLSEKVLTGMSKGTLLASGPSQLQKPQGAPEALADVDIGIP